MSKKKFWIILVVVIIFINIIINPLDIHHKTMEKSDEEYAAVLIDNKEDFDYVAEMMLQWPKRSIIDLEEGISSENPEIADEIANNKEFYEHLKNLYELGEVSEIVRCRRWTEFRFRRAPKDYHGGWFYWVDPENAGSTRSIVIDEHWTLEILPNV